MGIWFSKEAVTWLVAWLQGGCGLLVACMSLGDPGRLALVQDLLLLLSNGDSVSFKIKKYFVNYYFATTLFKISQQGWKLGQLPTS
jgi:hypothetical protein